MGKTTKDKTKAVSRPARQSSAFRELMPWHWGERRGVSEGPFEALQNTMNRLLDTFRMELGGLAGNGDFGVVASRIDVGETDDEFEINVELPGMDETDVEVSVTHDALRIHGEKKNETEEKKKNYHYRECSYGSVDRIIALPEGADADHAAATFKKGVLTVTLPKTAEAQEQARKIHISA